MGVSCPLESSPGAQEEVSQIRERIQNFKRRSYTPGDTSLFLAGLMKKRENLFQKDIFFCDEKSRDTTRKTERERETTKYMVSSLQYSF